MGKVLVVDDERLVLHAIKKVLSKEGFDVLTFLSPEGLEEHIAEAELLIMDIRLLNKNGVEVVEGFRAKGHNIPVVFITAYTDPDMIVKASRLGALDVLKKPFGAEELLRVIKGVTAQKPTIKTVLLESKSVVCASKEMFEVLKQAGVASGCELNVLITGETGVGKEIVARLIHANSARGKKPFVALNCSAIPKELFEAELFGYAKGAFTGAASDRKGKVEQAEGGTLFLDEVGELPYGKQAKLLRFIEEKSFYPLGSGKELHADVRIICATNRNIKELVQKQEFREDLFYRISQIHIHIPPLRERKEDIPPLVEHFISLANKELGTSVQGADNSFIERAINYSWYGNVRELKNVVFRACIKKRYGVLTEADLELKELEKGKKENLDLIIENFLQETPEEEFANFLERIELIVINKLLEKFEGNKSKVARILGISRNTLTSKLKGK